MVNSIKTILLLGLLSALLIFFGGLIAGQNGIYLAFLLALGMNGIAYFYADKIALSAAHARLVSEGEAPQLYRIVQELAQAYQIPMPKIYVTPEIQGNAFATGRNPSHASIAVTQGLLQLLPGEEVKAVLAHELGHIKHRDILISSIAAVLASALSFIANIELYGGGFSNRRNNEGQGLVLLAAIFLPISAMLIQLAVSRQREYNADLAGAKILGTGKPLAEALLTIDQSTKVHPEVHANPAFSHLYISNPSGSIRSTFANLFSTHPPTQERVKRLLSINTNI